MAVRTDYSQVFPVIIPSIMVDVMHFKNLWMGGISAHAARVHPTRSLELSSNIVGIGRIAGTRVVPDSVAPPRTKFFTVCSRGGSQESFSTGAALNFNAPLPFKAFVITLSRAIFCYVDSVIRHLKMRSANQTRLCSLNRT